MKRLPGKCQKEGDLASVSVRFEYDAFNRRAGRQDGSAWVEYVHDQEGHLLAELKRPATPAGAWSTVREYVWLEGQPLAQQEYPGPAGRTDGYTYYYHLDHLGQPRALTGESGARVWAAAPGRPYGNVVETTAVDPLNWRTVSTRLRLPGQYDEKLLTAVGLPGPYYNWNRWYLPGMGRYMELDPIAAGGGFNGPFGPEWYGYASANPLVNVDPMGLSDRRQYCDSLAKKIQEVENKIRQRIGELDEDPLGLPESCTGDKESPSLSRRGHRKLINLDKKNLALLKAHYALHCGGQGGPPPFSDPFPVPPPYEPWKGKDPWRTFEPNMSPAPIVVGTGMTFWLLLELLLLVN